jgi:hypothetical protein
MADVRTWGIQDPQPSRRGVAAPHVLLLSHLHTALGPTPRRASMQRLALGPHDATALLSPRARTE